MSAFEEFGVMPEIIRAVEDLDWQLPTDVQAEAIPLILGGGDVLMAAETGSGKTGAFSLPVLQIVHETLRSEAVASAKAEAGAASASASQSLSREPVVMNLDDRDSQLAIDATGLLCQSRDGKMWQGARASQGLVKGKYYYEATVTDEGLCRVGWSATVAKLDLGTDKFGYGFGGTGKKSNDRQFVEYGEAFGLNDVISCVLDLDSRILSFAKNGKDLGAAFSLPNNNMALYPAVVLKNAEMRFNFGASPFLHGPPAGFAAVNDYELAHAASIDAASSSSASSTARSPIALILEPSQELARQTYEQIRIFKKFLQSDVRVSLFTGGGKDNTKTQFRELAGGVDIAVGTPGTVKSLTETSKMSLKRVRFLVLDEADGLLANGEKDLIHKLYQGCPKASPDGRRLQMIVCSATLHANEVRSLAEALMHFPTWIDLKGRDVVPETVHQVCVRIDPAGVHAETNSALEGAQVPPLDGVHSRDSCTPNSSDGLSNAVKRLKPGFIKRLIDSFNMDQAIIFCRTRLDCDNLKTYLMREGGGDSITAAYPCYCLHSRVGPDRERNLQAFKDGEVRFLICTDVAARGIDVRGLPYVINATLPDNPADYIHRIGRVGRADRMGLAISLVATVSEKVWYHKCQNDKKCHNTNDISRSGCTIMYDEPELWSAIQTHTGETITELNDDLTAPTTLVDGNVVYGGKRSAASAEQAYENHVELLAPSVKELAMLEATSQHHFWDLKAKQWQM